MRRSGVASTSSWEKNTTPDEANHIWDKGNMGRGIKLAQDYPLANVHDKLARLRLNITDATVGWSVNEVQPWLVGRRPEPVKPGKIGQYVARDTSQRTRS